MLERVVSGGKLERSQARELIAAVMSGEGSELQTAGLLAALRTRGETLDEVVGAAEAMRELAVALPEAPAGAIDTCGTGGDGSNSLNISTLSALVAAGAGVPVAKHGNRAASSRCGSAEVLEALGVRIEAPPERMAESVSRVGIGFLFARACHPAMAAVAPVRSALGIRTLFNRLGPLTNPMRVRRQLVGVADAGLLESTRSALAELGAERVWVVHGGDGLDEISTGATTRVLAWEEGAAREFEIEPGQLVPAAPAEKLEGGDPARNAEMAREVLAGEAGAPRDAVLLNAAACLCVAGRAGDLSEGLSQASESIDSGSAARVLEAFAAFSRGESS
ncbi:MAG: anthranilate phosphoribosyltransferase [Proteobacteria bacterium]|nr:anthranilate phosphoribosyltransferase [Pseudomonadota bacterium]